MAIDSALGNAWLGRGLCQIRQGEDELGRRDLQAAAALEPNRSLFHSYLGKAFSNVGIRDKAETELERAKQLDPRDPTPWLYSAIENKQNNRINRAVRDLEKSHELNDNRRIYRSRFLLEQDRAVRSANLASIYQAAGMEEVACGKRPAGWRPITRMPPRTFSSPTATTPCAIRRASICATRRRGLTSCCSRTCSRPSAAGRSPSSSPSRNTRSSSKRTASASAPTTTYFTTSEWRETASQFGTFGNFSYSIDTDYQYDNGRRPNNEITRSETYAQMKYQITPRDVILLQTKYQDQRQGDLLQRYDQGDAAPGVHFRDLQQPAIMLAGYRHEWAPGVHTLLLAGRLADEITFRDLNTRGGSWTIFFTGRGRNVSRSLIFTRNAAGDDHGRFPLPLDLRLPEQVHHLHGRDESHLGNRTQHARGRRAFSIGRIPDQRPDRQSARRSPRRSSTFRRPRTISTPASNGKTFTPTTPGGRSGRSPSPAASATIDSSSRRITATRPSWIRKARARQFSPKVGVIWNPVGDWSSAALMRGRSAA